MGKIDPELAKVQAAHAFMLEDDDFADDGADAVSHLAAGRPIYFTEPSTPKGLVVRQNPDGRRDLMRLDPDGSLQVVRPA